MVMVIGMYGAVASAKYGERVNYHLAQSQVLSSTLQDLGTFPDTRRVLDEVRRVHRRRYPRLHRLRLRNWFIGLNAVVILGGAVLVIFTWAAP